jgi:small subunit ribosomal protein S6e
MNFKVVVSDPKTKKAYQKEIDQKASTLLGKKIGEKLSGQPIGLTGYELELTGGSDKDGFPMRKDVDGSGRKRIILSSAPGFHPERKGQRRRKSVRGNTISPEIIQVNTKVTGYGQKSLQELLGGPKEEKKEKPSIQEEMAAKVEKDAPKKSISDQILEEKEKGKKKEEPKEEKPKEEPKKEEPKEDKPKEEPKKPEEPKKEEPKEDKPDEKPKEVKEEKPEEEKKEKPKEEK